MAFRYETTISEDWIDYNGHMRDAYYGLVFSLAVDALQDAVGLDADYRQQTSCTIYLVEDHRFYLKEVHARQSVLVETNVLDVDLKRFHLHMTMMCRDEPVCIGEFMELHVRQKPEPHAVPMPEPIQSALGQYRRDRGAFARHRARAMQIGRKSQPDG